MMNESQRKKQAAGKEQDWAIIPFDEAEDDARWQRLIDETDELIKEAESLSNHLGVKLMPTKLSDLKTAAESEEDQLF